jgi:hypothetical protein
MLPRGCQENGGMLPRWMLYVLAERVRAPDGEHDTPQNPYLRRTEVPPATLRTADGGDA